MLRAGNGVDFDSNTKSVNISSGSDTSFVLIPITDNRAVERLESFGLSIRIPPEFVGIGVRPGRLNMATGFIIDDDGKLFESCSSSLCFSDLIYCQWIAETLKTLSTAELALIQHMEEALQAIVVMKHLCCVEQKTGYVSQMAHGLGHPIV